ncbi:glycosyltransferase [Pedococcus sp. KACC 23699]|uniref:Glycosyltransferase n=1 Tax=Pedococcus sp. KACC 23699 TaxID=3149228 RepID=A0AAU7JX01_9MICO
MTLRVAFLVDSPSKRAHGNAASRLALGLVQTGRAEVELVSYSDDPAPPWLPDEVAVHRLEADRASRLVPGLATYLRSHAPDVLITRQVHANFAGLASAGAARLRGGWGGHLVLVQDHLVQLAHRSNKLDNKWVARLTYRFADGVIAPSPTVRDNVVRWCSLDAASTALVPNPIPGFGGPVGPPPHRWLVDGGPPVFINVSNMLWFKRVDLLIDAFAEVRRHHDTKLLVLGEGPERAAADERIRALGLTQSAETVGWIDDPLQFATRAWALVHPSDEDGFAQVLTEAMSTGCPVVAADSLGGGPRFVTDSGAFGMLVPRGDRPALVEAMEQMLDPALRSHYSTLGLARAAEMSPTASANALMAFLEALERRRKD